MRDPASGFLPPVYRALPQATISTSTSAFTCWAGYLAMCLGMFMAILDIQIVATSLPEIQTGLAIPLDQLSWVQTAYLIAEIIAIPLTGWLTRLLSLRVLFLSALIGFCLASVGCAASGGFTMLIAFRALQGFCGGALIPTVFTAVFTLFPERLHLRATAIAGVLAMLAPTLGPALGGYITETYSWHWLFLVNLGPGVVAAVVAVLALETERPDRAALDRLDIASLVLLSVALASLEIALKEAPGEGWLEPQALVPLALAIVAGTVVVRRCLARRRPLVDFRLLRQPAFAAASFYSFVLGTGLYGSVYLLSIFLGYVRQHSALETGIVMMVGGAAQLVSAPFAALLEKCVAPWRLAGVGYALFAAGLISNGFMTYESDFAALFWPQIMRGVGVMLCLLPTTTVALECRAGEIVADASALFNLMRNLGGAVAIALIDTLVEMRAPIHAATLARRLQAGDRDAALIVGLPVERFHGVPLPPVDAATQDLVRPLIERAGAVASFNEAFILLGAFFLLSLIALPLLRLRKPGG
ncbi:MAG: drug resistance transporter, EmrB/QacA subfamily [Rhodospirillales bacterium]|nr:drug resistance transporter, EmrB/QacA subfamily [Rhodospirillales bacterium]